MTHKNMIPLVTSIPIRRSLALGQVQFVEDGHLSCIESWLNCGFNPISVNCINEAGGFKIPGVEMHLVERDAYEVTGKRLVYLEDMICAAAKRRRIGGDYQCRYRDFTAIIV